MKIHKNLLGKSLFFCNKSNYLKTLTQNKEFSYKNQAKSTLDSIKHSLKSEKNQNKTNPHQKDSISAKDYNKILTFFTLTEEIISNKEKESLSSEEIYNHIKQHKILLNNLDQVKEYPSFLQKIIFSISTASTQEKLIELFRLHHLFVDKSSNYYIEYVNLIEDKAHNLYVYSNMMSNIEIMKMFYSLGLTDKVKKSVDPLKFIINNRLTYKSYEKDKGMMIDPETDEIVRILVFIDKFQSVDIEFIEAISYYIDRHMKDISIEDMSNVVSILSSIIYKSRNEGRNDDKTSKNDKNDKKDVFLKEKIQKLVKIIIVNRMIPNIYYISIELLKLLIESCNQSDLLDYPIIKLMFINILKLPPSGNKTYNNTEPISLNKESQFIQALNIKSHLEPNQLKQDEIDNLKTKFMNTYDNSSIISLIQMVNTCKKTLKIHIKPDEEIGNFNKEIKKLEEINEKNEDFIVNYFKNYLKLFFLLVNNYLILNSKAFQFQDLYIILSSLSDSNSLHLPLLLIINENLSLSIKNSNTTAFTLIKYLNLIENFKKKAEIKEKLKDQLKTKEIRSFLNSNFFMDGFNLVSKIEYLILSVSLNENELFQSESFNLFISDLLYEITYEKLTFSMSIYQKISLFSKVFYIISHYSKRNIDVNEKIDVFKKLVLYYNSLLSSAKRKVDEEVLISNEINMETDNKPKETKETKENPIQNQNQTQNHMSLLIKKNNFYKKILNSYETTHLLQSFSYLISKNQTSDSDSYLESTNLMLNTIKDLNLYIKANMSSFTIVEFKFIFTFIFTFPEAFELPIFNMVIIKLMKTIGEFDVKDVDLLGNLCVILIDEVRNHGKYLFLLEIISEIEFLSRVLSMFVNKIELIKIKNQIEDVSEKDIFDVLNGIVNEMRMSSEGSESLYRKLI